ncbi:hypothetical protein Taro_031470 [Colocasia esculenta]|uniref:Endonuclease/exonuclease/phosphatase domain-containing protein n=1 Tax=Colocasia esculenta TaxID=4460 RepID=A0A843VNZ2_COLES|nr:hypothetical protein [Colocasia esculenta]
MAVPIQNQPIPDPDRPILPSMLRVAYPEEVFLWIVYPEVPPPGNLPGGGSSGEVLDAAARMIRPGVTTDEIDRVVYEATIAAGRPWCVDGDFNVVTHLVERTGAASSDGCMEDFSAFIQEAALVDVILMTRAVSDHRPILLKTSHGHDRRHNFKLE